MPSNLKAIVLILAKKYSWHTLGEPVSSFGTRKIQTTSKQNVVSLTRKDTALKNFIDNSPLTVEKKKKTPSKATKSISVVDAQVNTPKTIKFKPNTKSKKLIAERETLANEIYQEYNEKAFYGMLPADLDISWSKRLTSTAGITKMNSQSKGTIKTAEIVLSEKVVDDSVRLRSTLLHEMCHAASWLIDGERKPPHGPCFWKWASICSTSLPGMQVSTCHNYAIHKPYQFKCVDCHISYGRHSRKGVDSEKQCCGVCRGRIEFTGVFNADGTPKASRTITVLG